MAVTGVRQIQQNVGNWIADTQGRKTQQVLHGIMGTAKGYATLWTPVDTATLVNSLSYSVDSDRAVMFFRAGFADQSGFNYAEFLHNTTKWKPSKKPTATPFFLSRAFEDPEPQADFRRTMEAIYKA